MKSELELIKLKFEREKKTRKAAESLLENKALELYQANQRLEKFNEDLEQTIVLRNKKLQASDKRYRALVDTASELIFNLDEQGYITYVNPATLDILGYSKEELLNKHFQTLILPEYIEEILNFYFQLKDDIASTNYIEFEVLTKDNKRLWLGQNIQKMTDEKDEIIYSSIARDITLQKRFQTELEKAKFLAEEAQRAETEYLANMSHEIRTPLNAIVGMIHLMKDTTLDKEQLEYLEVLQSSSNMLLSLVSDVLDIAKIDAGALEVQNKTFNLKHLVNDLIKTFSQKTQESNISIKGFLDSDIPRYLNGDPQLINQVLLNLMSNACKFTKDGYVHLYVNLLEKKGSAGLLLNFEVKDTGIGMPKENIDRIFKNYRQASRNIKNEYGGTGLGLAIAQKLVGLMDGKIQVESKVQKGSIFSFSLRLSEVEEIDERDLINMSDAKGMISNDIDILVVDDNDMNLKYITRLLDKWNIRYNTALNGQECLDIYQKDHFDMIFMDLQMPVMGGFEATRVIRSLTTDKALVPIVALTASTLLGKRKLALEQGMTDFLSKPFKPNDLKRMISQYCNTPEEEQAAERLDVFSYPLELDVAYLEEVYGDDYSYALEMFEIFLDNVNKDFPLIFDGIDTKNNIEVKKLVHKLKPTFAMVGIPRLTDMMEEFEELLEKGGDSTISEALNKIKSEFDTYIPIVNQVVDNLKNKVNTNKIVQ